MVTVDDGTADCETPLSEHVETAPQLFVSTREVGGSAAWLDGEPLLSWDDLEQLSRRGVSIGAHARTHRPLAGLGADELANEVGGSLADLQERLPDGLAVFAYPNGSHDEDVRTAAVSAGFRAAWTTEKGRNGVGTDAWCLRRIAVHAGDGRIAVLWKVADGRAAALATMSLRRIDLRFAFPHEVRRAAVIGLEDWSAGLEEAGVELSADSDLDLAVAPVERADEVLGLGARAVVLEGRGGARKLRNAGYATSALSPASEHRSARPPAAARARRPGQVRADHLAPRGDPAEAGAQPRARSAGTACARPAPAAGARTARARSAGDARGRGALRSARRRRVVPDARSGRRPDARGLPRVRPGLSEPGLGGQDGSRARLRRAVREGRGRARARRSGRRRRASACAAPARPVRGRGAPRVGRERSRRRAALDAARARSSSRAAGVRRRRRPGSRTWESRRRPRRARRRARPAGAGGPAERGTRPRASSRGSAQLPAVLQHNDLGTWNAVWAAPGEFTVLDWESARANGLPLWDLLYFSVDALGLLDGARTAEQRADHAVRLLRGELPASQTLFETIRRYVSELAHPRRGGRPARDALLAPPRPLAREARRDGSAPRPRSRRRSESPRSGSTIRCSVPAGTAGAARPSARTAPRSGAVAGPRRVEALEDPPGRRRRAPCARPRRGGSTRRRSPSARGRPRRRRRSGSMPSAPLAVVTTGRPDAIASSTLTFIPLPRSSG